VREPRAPARAVARRVVSLWPVVGAYVIARALVLRGVGGVGGSCDQAAPAAGKALQIVSGLVHCVTTSQSLGEGPAWALGLAAWILMLVALGRGVARARRAAATNRPAAGSAARVPLPQRPIFAPLAPLGPLAFVVVALVPLAAARWIVGARYFYVPAAGVAWLAAEALRRRPVPAVVGVICGLAGLGLAQDLSRRVEIQLYETKLAAARRAVVSGLAEGHTTFHIASGIKDLDLAVKEDPRTHAADPALLVLNDVPASFVAFPESRRAELALVLARPPLPPSGAYRFGGRLVAGLARRGEDPTLDEVTARFPDIRFIRLRAGPEGRVIARDVTGLPASDLE